MSQPIFSSKGLYQNKSVLISLIIYFIAMICFFAMYPDALQTVVGYAVSLGIIMVLIAPFSRELQTKKSYIELFDTYVVGFSIPKKMLSNDACSFTLNYSDITHISTQKNIVEIHFVGGSYIVQAYESEQKVINIIKNQQKKIKE